MFGAVNEYRYINYEGVMEYRKFIPLCLRWGASEHHPTEQWLLETFDIERKDYRTYALSGIQPR